MDWEHGMNIQDIGDTVKSQLVGHAKTQVLKGNLNSVIYRLQIKTILRHLKKTRLMQNFLLLICQCQATCTNFNETKIHYNKTDTLRNINHLREMKGQTCREGNSVKTFLAPYPKRYIPKEKTKQKQFSQ